MQTGLRRLVSPIAPDDWEANPINSFSVEFRRTIAAIRYYDEKIASLPDENDLVWGMTEQVEKGATEFEGTDTTYASKLNEYEVARRWERTHLTDLHKLWITAKLDVRKLEIEQRYVEHLDIAIVAIISQLGKDPRDVEVRNIVRAELAKLGPPGRQEINA